MRHIVDIKIGSTVPEIESGLFEGIGTLSSCDSSTCDQLVVPEKTFKDCSSLKSVMFYGDKNDVQNLDVRYDDYYTKTGSYLSPVEVFTKAGDKLEQGVDYEVTYSSNRDAGIASFTVNGIGKYDGKYNGCFEIFDNNITAMRVDGLQSEYQYTGSDIKPVVSVFFGPDDKQLTMDRDYTATYDAETKFEGTKHIVLRGMSPYTGSMTKTYEVKSDESNAEFKTEPTSTAEICMISAIGRIDVDWGDGSVQRFDSGVISNVTHTYSKAKSYNIKVKYNPEWIQVLTGNIYSSPSFYITDVNIPASVKVVGPVSFFRNHVSSISGGAGVEFIGREAFAYNPLSSIHFLNCLSVGAWSFQAAPLTSISLPKLKYADKSAFYQCKKLEHASLPSLVETSSCLFSECTILKSASLPKLTALLENSFWGCSQLSSVNLSSVQSIVNGAFVNCSKLSTLDLPSLTTANGGSFSGLPSLRQVRVDNAYMKSTSDGYGNNDSVLMSKTNQVIAGLPFLTKVKNTAAVSLGSLSLRNCSQLTSFDFPQVTSVYSNAFPVGYGFNTLSNNTLVEIGDSAFSSQANLRAIHLDSAITIGSSAFNSCYQLTAASISSATSIKDNAFYYCRELLSVDAQSAQDIGLTAFGSCWKLKSILVDNCQHVGAYAFQYDYELSSFNASKLRDVGTYSFRKCTKLSKVDFPLLSSVSDYSFYECSALTSAQLPNVEYIGGHAFDTTGKVVPLKQFSSSKLTCIGPSAFRYCSQLASFDAPSLLSADDGAFCYSGISSIDFPSLVSLGRIAFIGCNSLTQVNIPNVTSLGDSTFENCSRLSSTLQFNSLTSIGAKAFYNCSQLKRIELRSSSVVTLFDSNAFTGMNLSYKIAVPANLYTNYINGVKWSEISSHIEALPS